MQIKIALDNVNHEYLKNRAKQDRRTLSAELNVLLDELRTNQPFTNVSTITQEKSKLQPKPQPKRTIIGDEKDEKEYLEVQKLVKFLDKEEIPSDDDSRTLFERY